METFLTIVVILFSVLFVAGVHGRFWKRRYSLVLGADATYYARTRDGWRLALHRYQGGDGEPVVLCHGMGANAYNMDLGDRLSLARYLKRRGYDVWSLELRGAGFSRIRDRSHGAPRQWCFDDHVRSDVPAAIDRVLDETQCKRLHWVGHSLGGMVVLAYLSVTGDKRIASVCTLASPTTFESVGKLRLLAPVLRLFRFFPPLPARSLAAFGIPFWRSLPITLLTHQGSNTDASAIRAAMANLVEPVHPGLLAQVGVWLSTGRFVNRDRSIDYGAGLAAVATPGCFIVGAADRLARADDVRAGFDRLRTRLKELYLLGKATGSQQDYGHGDLAVGRNAPTEVYSLIEGWLDDRRRGRRIARTVVTLDGAHNGAREPASGPAPSPTAGAAEPHGRNPYDPYARRRRERAARRSSCEGQPRPSRPPADRQNRLGDQ